MSLTRNQRERIEELAMQDKDVQRAFRQLERTDPCNDAANRPALRQLDRALDSAVREAAQNLNVRLTEAQGNEIENILKSMSLEGRGGICPSR